MLKIDKILFPCALLLAFSSCRPWTPASEPDMVQYELKGNISSMRNTVYSLDSTSNGYVASRIEPSLDNIYIEFDELGRKTLLRRYNSRNEPTGSETFTYGKNGLLKSEKAVSASGDVTETTTYTYRNGRLHSLTVRDGLDSLRKREEYRYFGKDSVKVTLNLSGKTDRGYRILAYDRKGRNISNRRYSADGEKVLSEFRNVYDSTGRVINAYTESVLLGRMDISTTYDENGFRSEQHLTGNRGETSLRYTFKVDKEGNWTERITERNGTPIRLEIRELKYRD